MYTCTAYFDTLKHSSIVHPRVIYHGAVFKNNFEKQIIGATRFAIYILQLENKSKY